MLNFNRLVAGWLAFCYAFTSMLAGMTWLFFLLAMLGILVIFIICNEINRPRH